MTAADLLKSLCQRDVIVTADGDRLQIDAPCGILTEELTGTLSELKPEILRCLHGRSHGSTAVSPMVGEVDAESIASMSLDIFAKAGLVVQVWFEYLGRKVLFVSDNVPAAAVSGTGLSVYRASELSKLAVLGPEPRNLRRVHDVKTFFNGKFADAQPREV